MATILTSFDQRELKDFISESVAAALQRELPKLITNTPTDQKQFHTRQEAAEILGISIVTLDSYVKAGFINAFRLGHKVRFKHNDILQALTKINVGG